MLSPSLAALTISGWDVGIVLAYLSVVTLMGLWIGRGNASVSDYLLGDRNLPWWAVLGSIVATETSTVTFLSVPGIAFDKGGNFGFLQLSLGYIIGRIIVAVWLLPLYFKGQLFTAYEVLHKRFGGLTQKTASLIFLITRNLGDSLRLFLTAIVVEKVTGLSLNASIIVVGACTADGFSSLSSLRPNRNFECSILHSILRRSTPSGQELSAALCWHWERTVLTR